MPKRVWILGAGFSAPLGAPLLADLFSMRMWRRVEQAFPRALRAKAMVTNEEREGRQGLMAVYSLYQYGTSYREGTLFGRRVAGRGESLYQHAEDFLMHLEMGTDHDLYLVISGAMELEKENNPYAGEILRWLGGSGSSDLRSRMLNNAKRLMALECSAFHVNLMSVYTSEAKRQRTIEPYLPYQDWGQCLNPAEDAIISFNYDLVVEEIVKPPDGVSLMKLHGSVQEANLGSVEIKALEPYRYLIDQNGAPNIKIPGKSKAEMNDTDRALWNRAGGCLEQANEIIFLGYGLPESDAYARQFILKKIWRNQQQALKLKLVLGEKSFRAIRLKNTLEMSQRGTSARHLAPNATPREHEASARTAEIVEMYSQDYLQAYANSLLDD